MTLIGVDLAKNVFQIHAATMSGKILFRKKLTRMQFQRLIVDSGVTCSISRPGNCRNNAAIGSFFSSFKTERVGRKVYRSRDEAMADVFDYVERFYNPTRRHSTIGYKKPHRLRTRSRCGMNEPISVSIKPAAHQSKENMASIGQPLPSAQIGSVH